MSTMPGARQRPWASTRSVAAPRYVPIAAMRPSETATPPSRTGAPRPSRMRALSITRSCKMWSLPVVALPSHERCACKWAEPTATLAADQHDCRQGRGSGTGPSCEPDPLSSRLGAAPLSSKGHARGRQQPEAYWVYVEGCCRPRTKYGEATWPSTEGRIPLPPGGQWARLPTPAWRYAMEDRKIERRLAAILAADIVGYGRLMGVDEVGTLRALKAHRKELVDPSLAAHRGRIVKTTGDGMLVEFASVV